MMNKILIFFFMITIWIGCAEEKAESTIMGYTYEHVIQTDGQKAAPGDVVVYDYYLKNDKGELYEASKDKGGVSEFRIPTPDAYPKKAALIELMKVMSVGDSARLYYPIDSLPQTGSQYSDTKTLIYELVIRDVKTAEEFAKIDAERQVEQEAAVESNKGKVEDIAALVAETLAKYKAGSLGGGLVLGSGFEYIIHEEGTGPNIQRKDNIKAHYYGVLESDGTMFDNSFSRGQPFSFVNGKGMVIQGWDEGFKVLKKGSKATLFIPYPMAYGAAGRPPMIPEKTNLVFYVEVVGIN